MRIFLGLALVLAACTPQLVERTATSADDVPERRALFPGAPTTLNESFRAACNDPGDTYARPVQSVRQCRSLPTPDLAAYLLLEFDGALEVPLIIIQTEERPSTDGVEVAFSYYAEVPQKSGALQRVYFRDRRLDEFIDLLLVASGGSLPDGA